MCNIPTLKCLKMIIFLLYTLLSCVSTTGRVNQVFSIIDISFSNNYGKFWKPSVILTDCNSHSCPVGGRCVKLISYWLEIPVSCAAERGFSFQNKIKMAMRSRLSERKIQNLMIIASTAITLVVLDYAQASAQFKSKRARRMVWVQATAAQFS